jgi:Transcription factor Iwr1
MSSSTTILRVKRPRHAIPISILSFQGKKRARVDDVTELSDALKESTVSEEAKNETRCVVWKRKETALESNQAVQFVNKRSLNCVDAILEGDSTSKRQRLLTLVQKSPSSSTAASTAAVRKLRGGIIVNPAARLVKESLESAQEGIITIQQHMNYIEQDPRLLLDCKKWILTECKDGSNVLHLCALWNDVEMCRKLCMIYSSTALLDHSDHSQQRPYQIAQLTQNTHVADVLEAFGADTNDFVYDIYHLQSNDMKEEGTKYDAPLRVDLSGGIGYWNDHGDLILKALCPEDFGDADSLQADDDEDSNAEDADANDYPEEEDTSEDDEDYGIDDTYRHVPIYNLPEGTQTTYPSAGYVQDDDDEYDAQYGLYEASGGSAEPRVYAYDPSHDDEAND